LTSLALHSTTAVLVYLVALRLLLLAQPRAVEVSVGLRLSAAATALFFAIHPLRVEPVAWASDRATILAGPFFVGCLLAYLRAWDRSRKETPSKKWLSSAVLLYALSLLAKPVALGLPIILIILDIYPIKSLSGLKFDPSARRIWWWKLPFLLCALAAAGAVFLAKAGASTKVSLSNVTLALGTPAFYLWKSLVPFGLSYYERPLFLNVLDWRWLLAWSTVIGLTVLAVALRRYWPAVLAAWSSYLLLLAPSLGLVRYGTQMAADRYTYLPSLCVAMLVGAGMLWSWRVGQSAHRYWSARSVVGSLLIACMIGLSLLSWKQTHVWHDTERFWTYVLTTEPNSVYAHNNLAVALIQKGQLTSAFLHLRRGLELQPNDPQVNKNFGVVLVRLGRSQEATTFFSKAVELAPWDAAAHNDLGAILLLHGRPAEAVPHFRMALQLDPTLRDAQQNLDAILASSPTKLSLPQ